ncbi:MAG: DUF2184 domain-containing protein [Iphinoe sp. HA4291-MV1]|jgi:hypothetical protein|nr:DUF2184 domain-containing protein [Iphinoe sp. HA4291-MV1]
MADTIGAGKFLVEELAEYDEEFYETTYPEYWAATGQYIPSTGDLRLGTKKFISGRIDTVGKATIYDGKATDIQLADFGITADEYRAVIVILAAEWNIFDIAAAEEAKLNALLPDRDFVSLKMEALNRGITQRLHEIVAFGDATYDMDGMLNSTNVELITETNDVYTYPPDALYNWIRGLLKRFRKESLLTASATDLFVPTDFYDRLLGRFTTNNDGNPFELLTNPQKGQKVGTVTELNELSSNYLEQFSVHAAGTNKDRLVLLERDPKVLRRKFYATDRTEPMLGDDGITYRLTGYAGTTEVQFRQPYCVRYIDIPKFNNQAIAA